MSEAEAVESQARPYAKRLFLCALIVAAVALIVYFQPYYARPLRIPFAFCLPLVGLYSIYLTVRIYRAGTGKVPIIPLVIGVLLILAGIGTDVIATVIKTPSLSREFNPIARDLLSFGYSVEFVYAYGAIGQSVMVSLACLMWATFLRHRKTITAIAWQLGAKTAIEFINATVYRKVTSKVLWMHSLSEYRRYDKWYHAVQPIFLATVVTSIARLYLGLEWLGLVPHARRNVLWVIACIVTLLMYYTWIWIEYSQGRKAVDDHTPRVASHRAPNVRRLSCK
jgi:hypothetical protein